MPTVRVLNEEEYLTALLDKLDEESKEVREAASDKAETLGELSDVLEVVYAIGKKHGITPEEIEAARIAKVQKRGGFDKRIFLISTAKS